MTSPIDAARDLLGVPSDADADAVRTARRRLAKLLHPDRGGDAAAMRDLNEAADVVLAALAEGQDAEHPDAPNSFHGRPNPGQGRRTSAASAPPHGLRFDHDVASFTIEALPVEAFEALLVATTWLGEVLVDERPYQLDVVLGEPVACWCRLDLVPDAGATTVAVTIAALPDRPLPAIDDVRDVWVAALNELGRDPSQLDRDRR